MSVFVPVPIRALLPIVAIVFLAIAADQARARQVSGLNVRTVDFAGGTFVQTDGQNWVEYSKATGQPAFRFVETFRDANEIKLFDASRRVHIAF